MVREHEATGDAFREAVQAVSAVTPPPEAEPEVEAVPEERDQPNPPAVRVGINGILHHEYC
jgi:hypothetical protein